VVFHALARKLAERDGSPSPPEPGDFLDITAIERDIRKHKKLAAERAAQQALEEPPEEGNDLHLPAQVHDNPLFAEQLAADDVIIAL